MSKVKAVTKNNIKAKANAKVIKSSTKGNIKKTVEKERKPVAKNKAGKKKTMTKEEEIRQIKAEMKELNKKRRCKSKIPDSVQKTLPYITEFKDMMLIDKNRYSMCMSFSDISYQILKPEDAEGIFAKWRDLINSFSSELTVQVISDNHFVNETSFEKNMLLQRKDDELDELRDEYNNMLIEKSQEKNQLQKNLYIVISTEARNPTEAKNTFIRLEGEISAGLKRMGSTGKRLDIGQWLEVLYNEFHPDKVGEFAKSGFDYNSISKNFISTKDYIAPTSFDFKGKDYFMIGNKYARCLFANNYPAIMSDRFFGELTDQSFNVIANMTLKPYDMEEAFNLVRHQISGIESNIQDSQRKANQAGYSSELINPNMKRAYIDAQDLMDELQNQNQKMFSVDIAVMHTADSLDELDEDTETLMSVAGKRLCQLNYLDHQQENAMCQILPFGHRKLFIERTLTSESTAGFIPFTSQELMDKEGFYYGQNAVSKKLILFNRVKSLMNCNGFILGCSGAGKSFAVKREVVNILLNTEDDVIVIDPEREYGDMCRGFRGEDIFISAMSKTHFNPLDMSEDYAAGEGDPIIAKADFILSMAVAIKENLMPADKSIVDRCTREVYEDYVNSGYDKSKIPTLMDFQKVLERQTEPEARDIALAFEMFTKGSLNVFAHKTNVDINNRFIVYDINELGKSLSTLGLLVMLDSVWNRVVQNRKKGKRTWVYVDEIYLLFKNPVSADFLLQTFKRIRKYKGASTGITQNVGAMLKSEIAREMIGNSEFIVLLNQSPNDRQDLADIMKISETQLGYVTDVDRGEGLIKAGRHIIPFFDKFPKETRLYELMTTDPDDIKTITEKKKQQEQAKWA